LEDVHESARTPAIRFGPVEVVVKKGAGIGSHRVDSARLVWGQEDAGPVGAPGRH
jgi:hypothetical protein